jgi:hypothetical protein
MARYHSAKPAPTLGAVVAQTLEANIFLGRDGYEPDGADTGYRNGYGRPREIGIGTWSVMVRPPRVSDLPAGAEPFGRPSRCAGAISASRASASSRGSISRT